MRPTAVLRPHEETIRSRLEEVRRQLESDGVQRDPILVDRDSGAVLDGMHRLAALSQIGVQSVVCCELDYMSAAVKVGRWARAYESGDASLKEALEEAGLTRRVSHAEAATSLATRELSAAAFTSRDAFVGTGPADLRLAHGTVRSLDDAALSRGWRRRFVPEEEAEREWGKRGELVLMAMPVGKEDVLGAALHGELFPCKATMHSVDPRPVAVNVPLRELSGPPERVSARLPAAAEAKVLPPNSMYQGRRYKERLLVLRPE